MRISQKIARTNRTGNGSWKRLQIASLWPNIGMHGSLVFESFAIRNRNRNV